MKITHCNAPDPLGLGFELYAGVRKLQESLEHLK
jgi:hypothetical protein